MVSLADPKSLANNVSSAPASNLSTGGTSDNKMGEEDPKVELAGVFNVSGGGMEIYCLEVRTLAESYCDSRDSHGRDREQLRPSRPPRAKDYVEGDYLPFSKDS